MRTILLIDDDPDILAILAEYLSLQGYGTITAPGGAAGMEAFDRSPPDAVICDLVMPRVGGLEVLDHVTQRSPLTPFVVLSGTVDVRAAVEALQKGAWDYLLKPLADLGLLDSLLGRLFDRAARLEQEVRDRTADLTRQLREKEALLAEVHHRVKNNLQVILALADLSADLPGLRRRLEALALVQEAVLEGDQALTSPLGPFVEGLVPRLLEGQGLTQGVAVTVAADPGRLDPGLAFRLGLALNEVFGLWSAPEQPWQLTIEAKLAESGVALVLGALPPPPATTSPGFALVESLAGEGGGLTSQGPGRFTLRMR